MLSADKAFHEKLSEESFTQCSSLCFFDFGHMGVCRTFIHDTQKNDDYITDPSVLLKLMIIISCGKLPYEIMCHKFWNCSVIIICLNVFV